LLNITSKIIGLELELFHELGEKEKLVYRLIGITFLITVVLASFSGGYFFYLIDSHFFSVSMGVLVYVFIVGSTFRVLLSTNRKSLQEVGLITKTWKKFIPSLGGLIRLYIVLVFSAIISFPLAAGMNPSVVEKISIQKSKELESKINSGVELLVLENIEEDLKYTHFPLATFEELINTGRVFPWLFLVFILFLFQQILLSVARNSTNLTYQNLAAAKYLELSTQNYVAAITSGFNSASSKYKVDLAEYRDYFLAKGISKPAIPEEKNLQQVYLKDEEEVKKLLQV
jgi:hypothetical protein